MRKALPALLTALATLIGCQDTATHTAAVSPHADEAVHDSMSEWSGNGDPCPLLGIPTTVRYEIQSGSERQYRVHLVNTAEAPLAADCQHQQPLPGNVVMRYRLANRA